MESTYFDRERRQESTLGLAGLILALAGGAALLYRLAGLPHLPDSLPSWSAVAATLGGSEPPLDAIAYLFTTAAWLLWLWIVGSMVLQAVAVCLAALTHGAAWARGLKALSDRVTLPVVRRLVEGALAVVILASVAARPSPAAAAPPLPAAIAAAVAPRDAAAPARPALDAHERHAARSAAYTVQPGDSLWRVSQRFYGVGEEYPRIVAANAGRRMPDGLPFNGVLQPGWVLDVPLPSRAVVEEAGHRVYVVEDGDTLRGIAARLLGDEMRWPAIYDINRGAARLEDGRTLSNPDLIWPGLHLRLPAEQAQSEPPPEPVLRAPDRDDPALRRPAAPAPVVVQAPAPTPPPASPSPTPTAQPQPTAVPTAVVALDPAAPAAQNGAPGLPYVEAGVGLLALGGAALAARQVVRGRRFRRSLDEPPIPEEPAGDAVVRDGFAEAEPARVLAQRLHGAGGELALAVADHAVRFLAEHRLDDAAIVTLEQGRRAAELTLRARPESPRPLAVQERLLELAPAFGARLGADGQATITPDRDVAWRLTGLRAAGLLGRGRGPDLPWLLPVGAMPGRETLYADWRELGHVLIAGAPNGGAEVVLTGLIAALTARRPPDELRIRTLAEPRALPERLADLPHQLGAPVAPADAAGAAEVLEELRGELARRMRAAEEGPSAPPPEVVLVVGELADLDDGSALDALCPDGPAHGIRVLAATGRPGQLGDPTLVHFRTRLVLRTETEDESVLLLDRPDAADLGGGGDLLLRIESREPVRARGFRVAPEHLDRLVDLMQSAYAAAPEAAEMDGEAPAPGAEGEGAPRAVEEPADAADARFDMDDPAPAPVVAGPAGQDVAGVAADRAIFAATAEALRPDAAVGPNASNQAAERAVLPAAPMDADGPRAAVPPVQVICFGGPRVLVDGVEVWPGSEKGGRHRPWEVLVFMATQPGEVVAKETLLAALWPDVDQETGEGRLRDALTHLRKLLAEHAPELPPDVVKSSRDGTCRLDPTIVASDVHHFAASCQRAMASATPPEEAAAACREARALYQDDLLTARKYPWAGERDESGLTLRQRYAEMHKKVTAKLADLHFRAGEVAEAAALYKELLQAEPTMESVVRNVFRCYHKMGDRSSLVREEHQLRQALREAFYDPEDPDDDPGRYQPSAETVALYEKFLADLEARVPVPS